MAKVIIAFIDSSKNAPHMLDRLENMLTRFFDGYFETTGIDREKAFKALPYYLGSQLLWYTEETQRIFSVPVWVEWRLELCRWSLGKDSFKIKELISFLSEERKKWSSVRVNNFRISDSNYKVSAYSGGKFTATAGDNINVHLEVTFPKKLERKISGLQVGVELWTDMDQEGAWYGISAFELKEMHGNKAIFEGQITPKTPGSYGMTARVVVNQGRPDIWSENEFGDIHLRVKDPEFTWNADPLWERAVSDSYSAVMMDYDGTIKDYDGTIPGEMYEACADMIKKGVHVAVNTSRSTPDSSIEFFNVIRKKMGSHFRPEFCHVYYGLGSYDLEDGTVEGFEATPEVKESIQTVLHTIGQTWLNSDITDLQVIEKGSLIGFLFMGKSRKDVFARVMNRLLKKMSNILPEEVVAVYSDNYFQVLPKRMTKQYWMEHFSKKTGIPLDRIVRIGDQGQRYGVDRAMCNSYGGFAVNHYTDNYVYPLSTSKYLGLYGIEGTVWLLKNLNYISFSRESGSDERGIKPGEGEMDGDNKDPAKKENGTAEDPQKNSFNPEYRVWDLDLTDLVLEIFGGIKGFIQDEIFKQKLTPVLQTEYSQYKPKGLILYADSMVEDLCFFDMGNTLAEGFFKSGGIFKRGAIVLYGTSENCGILKDIINKADPSIGVFTVESISAPSEIVELEMVVDKARRFTSRFSGIEHDFVGLIRGRTERAVDLVKIAKDIKIPIVFFDNTERGIYSFKMALTEAFNRRYSGSMNKWVCCLKPVAKLSEEAAENFNKYLLEQKAIATRA